MTAVPRSLLRRLRGESDDTGVTLVETVVALVVFGLMATAALAGLVTMLSTSRADRSRVQAANLATQQLEVVRNLPASLIPAGQNVYTKTVDNTAFTVTQNTALVADSDTQSTCDSTSGNPLAYTRITETVTWPGMGAIQPVRVDSLRAVNISGLSSTTGLLSVKVLDGSGQAQAGMPVSVTNTSGYSASQTTGADGCVVFQNVPLGTVTASTTTSGYVGTLGTSSATATATIAAKTLTRTSLNYDQAGSLVLTPATGAPATMGYTLYNANWPGSGIIAFPNCGTAPQCVTGNPRTISSLFPFAGGYQVWAGICSDADPSTESGTRATAVQVPAGGSATTAVTTAKVTVTTLNASGFEVYASKTVASGCSEVYDLGKVTLATPLSVQLPYGAWNIGRTNGVHTTAVGDANLSLKATGLPYTAVVS